MTDFTLRQSVASLCAIAASFGAGMAGIGWAERERNRRKLAEIEAREKSRQRAE